MASTATSLYDLAAELLTQTTAALATTPSGAPDRRYVSVSDPAFDCCDQLTVHAALVAQSDTSPNNALDTHRRLQYGSVNLVALVVTMLRCVPVMGLQEDAVLPLVADLTTSAQEVYRDGWVAWNYLQKKVRDNALFPDYPCRPVQFGPLVAVDPQGGCGGWTLAVSVELDGYEAV